MLKLQFQHFFPMHRYVGNSLGRNVNNNSSAFISVFNRCDFRPIKCCNLYDLNLCVIIDMKFSLHAIKVQSVRDFSSCECNEQSQLWNLFQQIRTLPEPYQLMLLSIFEQLQHTVVYLSPCQAGNKVVANTLSPSCVIELQPWVLLQQDTTHPCQ